MISSNDLIAVIEKNPYDFDIYAVVADLLEEEDSFDLACVFRWCERYKKCPDTAGEGWYWYSDLGIDGEQGQPHTISTQWAGKIDDWTRNQTSLTHLPRWRGTFREAMEMLIPFMEQSS